MPPFRAAERPGAGSLAPRWRSSSPPFVWPRLVRHRHALAREWPDLLMLGAIGMWICGAWVYIGECRTTPALNIGLIYAASPILVVALGRLLYRERLTAGRIAGIVLCLDRRRRRLRQGPLRQPAVGALHRGRSLDRRRLDLLGRLFGAAEAAAERPRSADPPVRHFRRRFAGTAALRDRRSRALARAGLRRLADLGVWIVLAIVPGSAPMAPSPSACANSAPRSPASRCISGPSIVGLLAWATLGEAPQDYHLIGTSTVPPGLFLATRRPPRSLIMRILLAVLFLLLAHPCASAEDIGSVGYRFKWLGPNDKIVVEAFDDPDVPASPATSRAPAPAASRAPLAWPRTRPTPRSPATRSAPIDASKLEYAQEPARSLQRARLADLQDHPGRALLGSAAPRAGLSHLYRPHHRG